MSADLATRMNAEVAAEAAPQFVINLCASTSPMALSHPNTPALKRYTFFVSRQREDGRERFRLHMGYFVSQEQAESLLAAVRDVYPAAWAGPAPTTGLPRRTRMSVAPAVTVTPPAPVVAPVVAPAMARETAPAALPANLDSMSNVRDVIAQLSENGSGARVSAPPTAAAMAVPRAPAADLDASQTLRVLEAATAAPRVAPTVAAAVAPKAAPPLAPAATRVAPPSPALASARAPAKARAAAPAAGEGEVRIVTPEDTQTLTDIRLDAQNNAPPCFAVQLIWAVAPIDVTSLPHLAIFDAYTLYNVEGSRQGRKWFGLRLGFFSDPNSATQVAHYVRSDYPAVAIVPVAIRERDSAKGGVVPAQRVIGSAAPLRPENTLAIEKEALDGFELLQDDAPRAAKRDVDDIPASQPSEATPVAAEASGMTAREKIAAAAAGKPLAKPAATAKPAGKRVVVRKRPQTPISPRAAPGAPNPLESTLEILGASTLSLDESREIVNDSAIRRPIVKKPGSRFSKLLSRLSGS